jgi:hypothetical protein
MQHEYKVAQFTGQLTAGMFGTKGVPLESQFQTFLDQFVKQGWEFYRTETIHAYVKAGCLAALLGRKDEVLYQDMVVFRKSKG